MTLATALGSSLTKTLYVLDEPSVGLHARDASRLAAVLGRLALAGNAVVVVEHDPVIIGAADHVIELGPGPGRAGGEVVYAGPLPGLLETPGAPTGEYLARRGVAPMDVVRRRPAGGPESRSAARRRTTCATSTWTSAARDARLRDRCEWFRKIDARRSDPLSKRAPAPRTVHAQLGLVR